ncbi:MAG: hypothetical protein ACOC1F_13260 [Myxococcota bacterium]
MKRVTLFFLTSLLATSLLMGCDEKPTSGVPLSATASTPVQMPPGHPPTGKAPKGKGMTIEGTVAETMDVAGYTYLHLDGKSGKVWAAVPRAQVKVGDKVTVERAMVMRNFESPSLGRKFDQIYFGVLPGGAKRSPHATSGSAAPASPALPIPDEIEVDKASGPNAHRVEEIFSKAEALSGKQVRVRGVVVKVNRRILGKNWVHLRDGTGSTDKKTAELVATSQQAPQVGSTVVMVGKVATDKDFGSGYTYEVLVEEATFESESGE